MKIRIEHTMHYVYDAPARHSSQYLRLVPGSSPRQRVLDWKLEAPGTPVEFKDGYGNVLHLLTLERTVSEILIRSAGLVETSAAIDEAQDEPKLSPLVFLRASELAVADAAVAQFAESYRGRPDMLAGLRDLASAVQSRLPPRSQTDGAHGTAAGAFAAGSGTSQDHAHVFIACCRHLGVPARFVNGYLHRPRGAESGVAGHAWVEAWVADRWRSFDVTSGGPAGEHHVRVAVGADYLDACPLRGVRSGGGAERLTDSAVVVTDQ